MTNFTESRVVSFKQANVFSVGGKIIFFLDFSYLKKSRSSFIYDFLNSDSKTFSHEKCILGAFPKPFPFMIDACKNSSNETIKF